VTPNSTVSQCIGPKRHEVQFGRRKAFLSLCGEIPKQKKIQHYGGSTLIVEPNGGGSTVKCYEIRKRISTKQVRKILREHPQTQGKKETLRRKESIKNLTRVRPRVKKPTGKKDLDVHGLKAGKQGVLGEKAQHLANDSISNKTSLFPANEFPIKYSNMEESSEGGDRSFRNQRRESSGWFNGPGQPKRTEEDLRAVGRNRRGNGFVIVLRKGDRHRTLFLCNNHLTFESAASEHLGAQWEGKTEESTYYISTNREGEKKLKDTFAGERKALARKS